MTPQSKSQRKEQIRVIAELYQAHLDAPFPRDCVGQMIEEIDLVLLDSYTAGCISTFLTSRGRLDLWRTAILGLCHRDLCLVASHLDGESRDYYQHMENLSRLVLEAVRDHAPRTNWRGTVMRWLGT